MKQVYIGLVAVALALVGYLGWRMAGPPKPAGQIKGAAVAAEIFIDVRTDEEWQAGHLDNAIHWDLAKMRAGQLPDLPKNTPLALYCRTGVRAGQALQILRQNGFDRVRDAGGFAALQAQGYRTCPGSQPACN